MTVISRMCLIGQKCDHICTKKRSAQLFFPFLPHYVEHGSKDVLNCDLTLRCSFWCLKEVQRIQHLEAMNQQPKSKRDDNKGKKSFKEQKTNVRLHCAVKLPEFTFASTANWLNAMCFPLPAPVDIMHIGSPNILQLHSQCRPQF